MSSLKPKTIAPQIPLTKEMEALFEFLMHQKVVPVADDREFHVTHQDWGGLVSADLGLLSEKQLDTKIRELENLNFRLNLDEGKEVQDSMSLGIVENE